jgi:hypothetical protein
MKLKAKVLFNDLAKPDQYGWYSIKVAVGAEDKQTLMDESLKLISGSNKFTHPKLAQEWYKQQLSVKPNKLPYTDGNLDRVVDEETQEMHVRPGLEDTLVLKVKTKFPKGATDVSKGDTVTIGVKLRVYDIQETKAYGLSAYLEEITLVEQTDKMEF